MAIVVAFTVIWLLAVLLIVRVLRGQDDTETELSGR